MDPDVALTQIRWTRSEPPGRATTDSTRRATYAAALQQFEELLNAARVAGPASRPLPLFYALSQAGRAIVAAHGEDPTTHGHGLGEVTADPGTPLLHRRVSRRRTRNDTFGAVARATRSGDFEGEVDLGALWVANPHSPRLPLEHWQSDWRLALMVIDENEAPPAGVELHEASQILRVLPFADPVEATADHGADVGPDRYPTIPDHAGATFVARGEGPSRSWAGLVVWRSDWASIDEIAPRATFGDQRYLVPRLAGQRLMLSPLMLWWVLLYGFSVYARYHPQLWVEVLDVDRSSAAVGIEQLLRAALEWLPGLIYQALLGQFYPVPPELRLE
jgi:hypothetical protein